MSVEPATAIATYFSVTKIWSIASGVCGSIIPILALADKTKIRITTAIFMALTGSSFAIFVGPWLAQKVGIDSIEGIIALSWMMGATGVYIVRSGLTWLDQRGVNAIDMVVNKVIGQQVTPADIPTLDDEPKKDNEKVDPVN